MDYVLDGERIGREMRYVSETMEGDRIGDWPPPSTTMRTVHLEKPIGMVFILDNIMMFNNYNNY